LGIIGPYTIGFKEYQEYSQPLMTLLKKGVEWKWDDEEQDAFDEVKNMLALIIIRRAKGLSINTRESVVRIDDEGKPIRWLKVDTTLTGAGTGVIQKDEPIPLPPEKSYKLVNRNVDPNIVKQLAERCADLPVTITQRELHAVSPAVSKECRINATRVRVPYVKPKMVNGMLAQAVELFPGLMDDLGESLDYDAVDVATVEVFETTLLAPPNEEGIPEGSLIITDPLMEYFNSLKPGEAPKQVYHVAKAVYVANDSEPIRVIFPTVNGKERVEAVIDGGSMIVSMAKAVARRLGLTWDPSIQITMQAANRSLKKSEGLAKNVLFQFGDVSAHLQVHIMESPAYDILLGRPFEVLTKLASSNQPDGECTITITDPNSGRKSSMVTWARGTYTPPTVEEVPDEDASPIKGSTNAENSASSRTVFRAPSRN
jgi:hypothetical protein